MSAFTRRTAVIGSFVAAAVTAIGLGAGSSYARERIETPKYTVVAKHEGFEVRRYAPRIVAEVEVAGKGKDASNAGFRVLASYIFGNNEARGEIAMTAPVDRRAASEEIAMTAPVDRRKSDEESWVITFTMPSEYTMETLPKPRDSRVKIREIPPRTYAVVRFSGAPAEPAVERRMVRLAAAVEEAGLHTTGAEPIYARYDPPWTLPFFRRNEVLLELDVPSDDEG